MKVRQPPTKGEWLISLTLGLIFGGLLGVLLMAVIAKLGGWLLYKIVGSLGG